MRESDKKQKSGLNLGSLRVLPSSSTNLCVLHTKVKFEVTESSTIIYVVTKIASLKKNTFIYLTIIQIIMANLS